MIRFFVQHRAPILLLVACTFIFGALSYARLPREANPDVDIPYVMVTTPYVGVSPKDIETLVTIPIENEVSGIKGLKETTSTSAEGVSIISLEFEPDVVIEDALQKVRDRVSRARTKIPEDAEDTTVQEISFSDMPIMLINIAGSADETVLKKLAEELQSDLERIPGALKVTLSGGRTREFQVQVDPKRLNHYELGLSDVSSAIDNENVNIPGGEVTGTRANFLVRVPGEFTSAREIESVAITRRGDRPVFVRDVADVKDTFAERTTYSRMNGQPSVALGLVKRAGSNIVEVAEEAKALTSKHASRWPKEVTYRILSDQSREVGLMVAELENNMLLALILVVGVILFVMGLKNSLFVALSIPLSMLIGMIVFSLMNVTLNMVVLFSLILVLGMLVDNAIVLVENIYRHLEMGKTPFEASVDGAKEIATPVAASTLTTVAAFAPLLAWTGIMGEFMIYLPMTVVIVLLSSLLVAVLMLPVVTSITLRPITKKKESQQKTSWILRSYEKTLAWAIRHRFITTLAMFGALIGSFMAYGALHHGVEFFPDTEPDRATVSVRAPDGTDLEETDRIVRELEQILLEDPSVESYVAETGVTSGDFSSSEAAHSARITINFYPHISKLEEGETPRKEDSRVSIARLREKVSEVVGADIKLEKERMGPPVGKPIALEISSKDYHEAGDFAAKVRRHIGSVPGVTGLEDNYRVGRPELRFRVDRGAAKRVGASTGEIASAVRAAVSGTKASVFRDGEDEYDIVVELAPQYKNDLESVLSLRIPGREDMELGTFSVPISSVASYELAGGTGSIRHKAQEPVVTVTGDVKEGFNQNAVQAAVMERVNTMQKPRSITARLGGANDEQKESEEFLSTAFLIALFLIAIVLVSQFNRFDLPLIVLTSVILSLVGVLWGLILTGTSFGVIMTGLGVISLAGVVVNNAIVLLDYVEQLRSEGRKRDDALIIAGLTRFRPVMLTAVTTILGLLPMAIGLSIDFRSGALYWGTPTSEWWGPMAVAVVFGLAFATLLTLVVVPTLYVLFDDIGQLWRRLIFRTTHLRSTRSAANPAE